MQPLILDDDQANIVYEMTHTDTGGGYILGSLQGAGKTVIVAQYIVEAQPDVSLIICPLGTRVGWERTIRRQGYEGNIVRIENTKDGLKHAADLFARKPGVYLIGREFFALSGSDGPVPKCKDHKLYPMIGSHEFCPKDCPIREHSQWFCPKGCKMRKQRKALWSWSKIKPDLAAYDEVHAVQNRNSLGFRVLKQLKAIYRIGMSGTWTGNKFEGAWAPSFWAFGKQYVDNSFWRWAAEWCDLEYDPFAGQKVTAEKVPGSFVQTLPGYARLTPDIGVEYTEEQRYVELSPQQRKVYSEMEQHLVTWLGDNPLVAEVPITMRIRLRQMTLGMPSFNEDGEIDFAENCKSSKIDALKEIISDLDDEPVLILTDSQKFASVVVKRLGKLAVEWSGKTSAKDRERILETFGRKGGPRYIVATIAAIGEGVDGLQITCNTAVWLSRSDNRILNEQAAKRLHRRGQTRPVRSIDILATETYDEGILSGQVRERLAMNESMKKSRREEN